MRIAFLSLLAALAAAPVLAKGAPRTLFISPMGEPFRTQDGAPEAAWFKQADKDGDGRLTLTEFTLDAARFFAILDTNHDGSLSLDEVRHYETDIAPEIQSRGFGGGGFSRGGGGAGDGGRHGGMGGGHMGGGMGGMGGGGMGGGGMGGGRGHGGSDRHGGSISGGDGGYAPPLEGAGRYGYIDTPEPVAAADADLSGTITRAEFLAAANRRFELLDANQDGSLTPKELPRLMSNPDRERRKPANTYVRPPSTDDAPSGGDF